MTPDGKGDKYPGLWLLSLTRFGFSPVDWFRAKADGWLEPAPGPPQSISGRLQEPLASSGWYITSRLTAIAILAGCILFCFFLERTNRISWPVWSDPGDAAAVRFPFFAAAAVFVSSLPWILGLPAAFEWNNAPTGQNFTVVLLGLAFLAPLGSLLWIGAHRAAARWEKARWYTDPMLLFAGPFYLLILITWWTSCNGYDVSHAMFRWRALHFYSSSSPALPLWLVCNVVVIGLLAEFYRRSDTGVTSPHLQLKGVRDIPAFSACYAEVNALIAGTHKWTRIFTCALVTGISTMLLWQRLPAFEKVGYNAGLEIAVFALIWALASLAHDSVLIWLNFSKLLSMVESIPLRGVISRVARALPRRQVWAFWKSTPQRALAVRMCEALHNRALAATHEVKKAFAAGVGGIPLVVATRKEEQEESALAYHFLGLTRRRFDGHPLMSAKHVYHARCEYEACAARIGRDLYKDVLWPQWKKSQIDEATGEEKEENNSPDGHHYSGEFVALHCCNYLVHVVRRIQQLVWNISFLLVLLIVVLNSYSPQGPVAIGRYIVVLFLAVGCVVFYVFAGMERDCVLSKISRTKPGELNLDFWLHLAALGILPLIALAVHLFPDIAGFLYSWVAPGLESTK
jgi:hypothetical protein